MVDGGKKRKVTRSFEPEKEEKERRVPFMVKTGGVRWDNEIGGVEVSLREVEVKFCEGMKWLVGKEELEKRKKCSSLASTVVVRVRGESWVRQLDRARIWVGGY